MLLACYENIKPGSRPATFSLDFFIGDLLFLLCTAASELFAIPFASAGVDCQCYDHTTDSVADFFLILARTACIFRELLRT